MACSSASCVYEKVLYSRNMPELLSKVGLKMRFDGKNE
jgi:hypothetical protein